MATPKKSYTDEQIANMTAEQRSAEWAGADDATRAKLHAANNQYYTQQGQTYNSASGTYSPAATTPTIGTAANIGVYKDNTKSQQYAQLNNVGQTDQQRLIDLQKQWYEAQGRGDQAGMDAAHAAAEAIRAAKGYSGGLSGDENLLRQTTPTNALSYGSAPSYDNRYDDLIQNVKDWLLNREAFSYDAESDPLYQQYAQSYGNNGRKAMQDTLGQLSARTGGLASSYAQSVAQQTYDGYMSGLADKIPELQQLAYSMYNNETDQQRQNLSMLQALERGDYEKYADQLAQFNTDRNFAYTVDSANRDYDYQVGRDNISDQRYNTEYADSRGDTDFARKYQMAKDLAEYGDFSGFRDLGVADQQIARMSAAYQLAAQSAASSGGSKKSGGGGGGGGGKPSLTYPQVLAAIKDGHVTDKVKKAYDYYMGSGAYEQFYNANKDDSAEDDYSMNDVDSQSVIGLGVGPISIKALDNLINSGKVALTGTKNGKPTVAWAGGFNATNYKDDDFKKKIKY